ncbi:methyl-CpG-binding domain protein 2-like isoform X1 [Oncorhynchus masou masou]|uniref:methyl-CpG-binding domain protein 2-like isoform X1 n=1 Tax=Oncorhynchus masou masou TaxID=90313 RepID=UPI0031837BFF
MVMEKKRMDCPSLPPGWKKEEVIRKSGLSAGKSDVYYYSPKGKKFRSKPQLSRYLGNTVDLGCFDFRTGKMMPGKMQKNKQRLRNENLTINKVLLRCALMKTTQWMGLGGTGAEWASLSLSLSRSPSFL